MPLIARTIFLNYQELWNYRKSTQNSKKY